MGVALGLSVVAVVFAAGQGQKPLPGAAGSARLVPAPVVDAVRSSAEVGAVLAGMFLGCAGRLSTHHRRHQRRVEYAGGEKRTAAYDLVGTGTTGHAESVQVTFDPRRISYGALLQIYFSVAHDPRSSIGRGRMPVRSTVQRSSRPTRNRRRSRRHMSTSSMAPACSPIAS
jgi:peptide-methionine (S)-S-oxide reductase